MNNTRVDIFRVYKRFRRYTSVKASGELTLMWVSRSFLVNHTILALFSSQS